MVVANLPLSSEVALLRQGERTICVIVPYAPVRGEGVPQIDEWPPVGPVDIGVRGRYLSAYSLPVRARVACRCGAQHSYAHLPTMRGPVAIIFE